jgi:hypothetical protein
MTTLTLWYIAPALLVLVGAVIVAAGLWHALRGRPVRGTYGVLSGAVLALAGVAIGVVGGNILTYARLSDERQVAEVSVQALDPVEKRFTVTVRALDGAARATTCTVQGDEWMLSARVQKWKPWVNLIGFDATYTLDQLANKYLSAAEANGKSITACDLTGPALTLNRYVPASWLAWLTATLQAEDRSFGSANYMPLADGAVYIVIMTRAGLNAEPLNDAARAANSARP